MSSGVQGEELSNSRFSPFLELLIFNFNDLTLGYSKMKGAPYSYR